MRNATLFADDVAVDFTADEWDVCHRPIAGDGGAQRLLRDALDLQVSERRLVLPRRLLDKAYSYAYDYGNGGFQDRFRMIVRAAIRAGWSAEGMRPPNRRSKRGDSWRQS